MKKRNLAIVICAAVLVCSLVIGGTLAYLSDNDTETNTFTVGDIQIDLTEPEWDDSVDGKDMYPGTTLLKDPAVTATEGDCYVRLKVQIVDTAAAGAVITDTDRLGLILDTIVCDVDGTLAEGTGYSKAIIDALPMIDSTFTADEVNSTAGTYYFNYNTSLAEGGSTPPLFTTIAVPTDYTAQNLTDMGSYAFIITAEAIQAENFATSADAFAALNTEFTA